MLRGFEPWAKLSAAAECDDGAVAYDEGLATRVRALLGDEPGLTERKMFGGLALLAGGHIVVGLYGDGLLIRAPGGDQERLLAEPGITTYAMGGQPMVGWLLVGREACTEDDALRRWVDHGLAHARSLPPK